MSMNIKNDLHKRVSQIIRAAGTLNPFQVRGSVQPVLDYHKVQVKHKTLTIPSTAGNVDTTLSPGKGKKITILYGRLKLIADATVQDRFITMYLEDSAGNPMCENMKHANAIVATETKYVSYSKEPFNDVGTAYQDLDKIALMTIDIYETDQLSIEVKGGQAGDAYSRYIKYLEEEIPLEA